MKDTFGERFTTYYDGDPEAIPTFNLPCIVVTQTTSDITEGAMNEDDVTDEITVKVVLNKRDDFTGDKVDPLNLTDKKIRDLVMMRDLETRKYDTKTVVGAIRNYGIDGARQDEGIDAVAPSLKIEFGINPRPAANADYADLTSEGHVTFSIRYSLDTD
ncbi:hypothetical protein HAV21_03530 [Paenarthrobacter sp. MSM-2-10-13]|uniref:hypothetical protein n=1 Tax=Paenarthrobacter sp. MSM-2-10-13 TaxID=2717318 RepID=UPI00141DF9A1|nr:hypothetical protein [Paenarthrobacter sp. MSM-2-10-13]NHW45969.1 hypothetical protein [Paenarthrobacter sp. MSM-2-10-13]